MYAFFNSVDTFVDMYIANLIVCLQEADPLELKECRKFIMSQSWPRKDGCLEYRLS